jgi:MOSC domain-containing protein YiiM
MAHIVSVNVGTPQPLSSRRGRTLYSAIVKHPVDGPVRVEGVNIVGDDQADRSVHGGPDKAVYAYAREDADWWEDVLGIDIPNAMFGENLTVAGLDVSGALIGERWRMGTVELEVCQPRLPCSKLGLRFGDLTLVKKFGQASRPGAYLRIAAEGVLAAGDEITIISRPSHGVTISVVSDAVLKDRSLIARVLAVPELSDEARAALAA